MADNKSVITDFLAEADKLTDGKKADLPVLLEAFTKYLKGRGQYVDAGSLQKQFSEVTTVLDKNKVPIEVTKCMVCGKDDFEVKPEE